MRTIQQFRAVAIHLGPIVKRNWDAHIGDKRVVPSSGRAAERLSVAINLDVPGGALTDHHIIPVFRTPGHRFGVAVSDNIGVRAGVDVVVAAVSLATERESVAQRDDTAT